MGFGMAGLGVCSPQDCKGRRLSVESLVLIFAWTSGWYEQELVGHVGKVQVEIWKPQQASEWKD